MFGPQTLAGWIPDKYIYERDNTFWVTQAIANIWAEKIFQYFVFLFYKMEEISVNAAQTTQATIRVCLHLRSNHLNGIINKMRSVSIPTIIGETADRNKLLSAKVTQPQHTQLQRWPHHILKCRMNSLVIHRLNHMNKRSKGKLLIEREEERISKRSLFDSLHRVKHLFLRGKMLCLIVRVEERLVNVLAVLKMCCGY